VIRHFGFDVVMGQGDLIGFQAMENVLKNLSVDSCSLLLVIDGGLSAVINHYAFDVSISVYPLSGYARERAIRW